MTTLEEPAGEADMFSLKFDDQKSKFKKPRCTSVMSNNLVPKNPSVPVLCVLYFKFNQLQNVHALYPNPSCLTEDVVVCNRTRFSPKTSWTLWSLKHESGIHLPFMDVM